MIDLSREVSRRLDGFESAGLAIQEFTALFRLASPSSQRQADLKRRLQGEDGAGPFPFSEVHALHTARWLLLGQCEQQNGSAPLAEVASGPLVFACTYDGDTEDMLRALVSRCSSRLAEVLTYCDGFPGIGDPEQCIRYLLSARQRANYFFADPEATATEVKRALAVRESFVEFLEAHQSDSDEQLCSEFDRYRTAPLARFGGSPALGYAFALAAPFERAIERESFWVRRAADLARSQVLRSTRVSRRTKPDAPALRGVHPKHHGCLKAEFIVHDDIDPRFQQGIFVPGRRYDALVRVSNSSSKPRADWLPDARGLAIKLLNVPGLPLLVEPQPDGLEGEAPGSTQDFVLVSNSTFFIKDARDYVIFRSILDSASPAASALRLLVFASRRPREASIFLRTLLQPPAHPLGIVYHSMTASLLGRTQAVKYSVRPVAGMGAFKVGRLSSDCLKEALQRTLHPVSGAPVHLEFAIHVSESDSLPVEDPRVDWDAAGARRVPMATIKIAPQDFLAEERMRICENIVYSPWHTKPEHQPLGSLNRARLAVYNASSAARHALNGVGADGIPTR